jgi:putative endonuclease
MAVHNDTGKEGELAARRHLQYRGYTILEENWRHGRSEVDIIAKIGHTLVFVEVKTRNTEFFGAPESFVTNKKQEQLAKAAEAYCILHPDDNRDVRYDIVAVILNAREENIQHFEDAFFPDNLGLY